MMKNLRTTLLPMTLAAGLVVAPMLALAQADGTPGNPPGTAAGRALERATGPSAPATTLSVTSGSVVTERPRLSQIIGGHVYNERNERVGEVDDVILATPSGTAQAPMAIIQVGGFLGMGGRLVAVPLNDLRWSAETSRIVMPGATKEALLSRTPFDYNSLRRG